MRQKRVCKENKNCANYIKAAKNYSFQQAVVHLIHHGMLELSENEMEQLDDLRKLRNRVHMWLAKDSDFMDREISFGDYNQAIILIHTIRDSLKLRYKDQQAKLIFCKNKQV
ncbi:hypothetical protein JCM14722_26730 [Pseudodesulfovibrio portus]|uniref:HEPN domain-containing protein n=1 Tax=Pseudodesulfovibrio portus TaxID=231439 RepID=A0ABM8AV04_9BACT|nr:hypothetical protein JCM14722_26730 [Pseudodesulfovibrio portus]